MDFALNEEQQELASTVRSLLEKRADSTAVRTAMASAEGFDPSLWSALAEQVGVAALAVPEQYDGVGATFFETAVVLEELGRTCAPSPLLATILASEALLAGGTEDAKARLLPRLAAGEIGTVALTLDAPVLDADRAAIVLAVIDGDLVELESPAVTTVESMDQTIRLGTIAPGGAATIIGDGAAAVARVDQVRAAAAAALAVGLSQRALDATVSYLKEREQFGRQIGSFQALKHRVADLLVRLEISRSASWAASYALADADRDPAEVAFLVHSAASYALESVAAVTGEAIQLHGGIAITWEHDAHIWFKRAHALGQLGGAPHLHRAALAL